MKEVFVLRDEIASKIMKTLHVELGVEKKPNETRGGSKNREAYLKSLEASEQILSFTREGVTRARQLYTEVIALEPEFSRGYSGLAITYGLGMKIGMSASQRSHSPKGSISRKEPSP